MKKHILGALIALPASMAHAETVIFISDNRAEEISSTTPNSIQIIDSEEIEASGASNLAELLAGRAGIQVTDRYGDGSDVSLDMRGFGATASSHTLVTVNGRRMNPSSDSGGVNLNSIDLQAIKRIEIVQGSASILYGNQAVGGMIHIITKAPGKDDNRVSVTLGSYGSKAISAQLGSTDQDGWGYSLNARLHDSDGYMDSTGLRLGAASLKVERNVGDSRVFMEFDSFKQHTDTAGALFANELAADRRQIISFYANDYVDLAQQQVRLGYHTALNEQWRFKGELGFRKDDGESILSGRGWMGSVSTQDRAIATFSPRLIGTLGDNTITLGADFEYTDYAFVSAFGPRTVDQRIQAIYGQVVHQLNANTDITAGLRHARVQNGINDNGSFAQVDDKLTVGSLGVSFRTSRNWRLFARADQNYRFATVDEHAYTPGFTIGLDNPTGLSYEIGTQYRDGGNSFDLVAYRLEMDNEIIYDSTANGGWGANLNLDQTRRTGIQASGTLVLSDTLSAGLGVDVTSGKFTSGTFDGKRIPGVPKLQARAHLQWQARPQTRLYLEAVHVGDQIFGGDAANAFEPLDSYTVVNFNVRHHVGDWLITGRINNLLDAEYATTGALGYNPWPTLEPAYNPAAERNFALSARYNF